MRIILQSVACFFCACLLGTLSHWVFVDKGESTTRPLFAPSALHGTELEKEGPISLMRWLETYSFSDKTAFPVLDRLVPKTDVMLGTQCASHVQYEERLVWVSDEGSPFGIFSPDMESRLLESWLLTLRNVEDVAYGWKVSLVFSVVWNPYVRFAAAYERFRQHLKEEENEVPISFSQFCTRPLSLCEDYDADVCWDTIQAAPSYAMAQTLCTFNENMHPSVDFVLDAAKLMDSSNVPASWKNFLSKEMINELQLRFREIGKEHRWIEEKAERLYRENPSCLQTVYEFYHADFLLLKYPKLTLF